jgi:hypothetical protein
VGSFVGESEVAAAAVQLSLSFALVHVLESLACATVFGQLASKCSSAQN